MTSVYIYLWQLYFRTIQLQRNKICNHFYWLLVIIYSYYLQKFKNIKGYIYHSKKSKQNVKKKGQKERLRRDCRGESYQHPWIQHLCLIQQGWGKLIQHDVQCVQVGAAGFLPWGRGCLQYLMQHWIMGSLLVDGPKRVWGFFRGL